MSNLIPDSQYIFLSDGFNTFQGDPLRSSFDKANQMISTLDQGKANLQDPEFTGSVRGPNILAAAGISEYITEADLNFFVENSPNLVDATFSGTQPVWDDGQGNNKKLLIDVDIKSLLTNNIYLGETGIEISRAVFTDFVNLRENGQDNLVATQNWVLTGNHNFTGTLTAANQQGQGGESAVVTSSDLTQILNEGDVVKDILANQDPKEIHQATLIASNATDINNPSQNSLVVSQGYLFNLLVDRFGFTFDRGNEPISFLKDLREYLSGNDFTIQDVVITQNLEVQGNVNGAINLDGFLTIQDTSGAGGFLLDAANDGTNTLEVSNDPASSAIVRSGNQGTLQINNTTGGEVEITNPNGSLIVLSNGNLNHNLLINDQWESFLIWDENNMGPGSGLDADLLDGQQGSWYASKESSASQDFTGNINTPQLTSDNIVINSTGIANTLLMDAGNEVDFLQLIHAPNVGMSLSQTGAVREMSLNNNTGGDILIENNDGAIRITGSSIEHGIWDGTDFVYHGIWDENNMGQGSGLDADLLDGLEAASFARIDQTTTQTFLGRIDTPFLFVDGDLELFSDQENSGDSFIRSSLPLRIAQGNGQRLTLGRDTGSSIQVDPTLITIDADSSVSFNTINQTLLLTDDAFTINGNTIWTENNDGSGSELDADLLDGIEGSSYARLDLQTNQTFQTGITVPNLNVGGDLVINNNDDGEQIIEATNGNSIKLLTGSSELKFEDISSNQLTVNGATVWNEENDGEDSGLDADLLDGKQGDYYLNITNFYDKKPQGNSIYVSSTTGDDNNFGFTNLTAVKTIKQAGINAYALQAAATREGGIRKDCYRILEANRELISEEIGLISSNGLFCGSYDARTYRDVFDLYGSISKDLLLDTNRNFRNVVARILEVPVVRDSWRTTLGNGRTLFEHMIDLMVKSLYFNNNSDRLKLSDFSAVRNNYSDDWVLDRLTTSSRDDSWVEDEFPCEFVRNRLREVQYPAGNTKADLPAYKTPNQSNRKPFTVIRIESGDYEEAFPMELPDNVSIFGDSLRKVSIFPREDIKQKGCGLHQRFISDTFTRLSFGNETWSNSVDIDFFGGSVPDEEGPLANQGDWANLTGQVLRFATNGGSGLIAEGEIQQVIPRESGNNTIAKVIFKNIRYEQPNLLLPVFTFVENLTTGKSNVEAIISWDLCGGYLLLRDENGDPLRLEASNQTLTRGDLINPVMRFANNQSTRFKLRKGDVLLLLDLVSGNRRELLRVEDQDEDIGEGNFSSNFSIVPHRLNERFLFNNAYVYLAPRAEWQTECDSIIKEGDFDKSNRSFPSTEVMTNSPEVGQQAFQVGNGNYVFQVNFKETTNFAFAFRRDRPRVFASPYIQNCSSLSTKGGGGILVDGILPIQPDDDFPAPILEQEPEDAFDEWHAYEGSGDISRALNMHYDGEMILRVNEEEILAEYDSNPIKTALNELSNLNVNYSDINRCKKDGRFILQAIRWQMLRGGNDKVYDFARLIEDVIYSQTRETEVPLESFNRVIRTYAVVLDALKDKAVDLIMNGSSNVTPGDCTGVAATVSTLFDIVKFVLSGTTNNDPQTPKINQMYDGANALYDDLNNIQLLFQEATVQTALDNLSEGTNFNSQNEKCRKDLRFLVAAIAWHLPRGGNDKVVLVGETIRNAIVNQSNGGSLGEVTSAYQVVFGELRTSLQVAIESASGVTPGDCLSVVSAANSYVDIVENIVVNGQTVNKSFATNFPTRSNFVALPGIRLARLQNAELRSFVLDAFTQINTFGGWGHLIRNNGYAQLVSTFTTFCDHGVKVESGGLINLSNSVCDFGFYGLIADRFSKTPYLFGDVYREERAKIKGRTPTSSYLMSPLSMSFNSENPVYQQRTEGELTKLQQDYIDEKDLYITTLRFNSATQTQKQEARTRLENIRIRLEKTAIKSIQFNTTSLFASGYNLFDGQELSRADQIPRGVAFIDNLSEESEDALSSFPVINDRDVQREIGEDASLEVSVPLIRVGYLPSQRIPHNTEIGRPEDPTPFLQGSLKDGATPARVEFYITTTLTSSAHGFEYVGSGNDYTNALPENGGTPKAENQLLETGGGRVFTSSTDVKGDFRVGSFFTVKQSTGAVTFNPNTLKLVNLSQIGPFTSNGITGQNVIKDLSNEWQLLVPDDIVQSENNNINVSTKELISTTKAISEALSETFTSLSERVSDSLLRTESNGKLLEALSNPTPDFGNFSTKLSLFHRSNMIINGNEWDIGVSSFDEDTSWNSDVSSMKHFITEFGGRYRQDNLLAQSAASVARNRSSFTLNFVIDTSESMSQSGKFWTIKQDLIDFFSGASEGDSIGIYKSSGSVSDKRVIKLKGETFFDQTPIGAELEIFGSNTSGNREMVYVRDNQGNGNDWWNNVRMKFGEAIVEDKLEREKKIVISNVKGYVNSGLFIGLKGGSANDIIDSIENGLVPSIHNVSQDVEEIIRTNPNFNFNRSIKLSLLKDIGVVFPTTKQVIEDGLLEVAVFNELKNITETTATNANNDPIVGTTYNYFNRPEISLPESVAAGSNEVYIIPAGNYYLPLAEQGPTRSYIENNIGTVRARDLMAEYYSLTEEWRYFFADLDPGDDANVDKPALLRPWEYLQPRSSVSESASAYSSRDTKVFKKYDATTDNAEDRQGFLTQDVIQANSFFKEQTSKPELDFVLAVHRSNFSDRNSCRIGAQGLMQALDDANMFDWKVGSVCIPNSHTQGMYVQDLYISSPDELPRKNIFNTQDSLFLETNRSKALQIGQGGEREYNPNKERDPRMTWVEDVSGEPATEVSNNSSLVEGNSIFWVTLPRESNVAGMPLPIGTIFSVRNSEGGPNTISVDPNSITLTQSITSIVVSDAFWSVPVGGTVTVTLDTRNASLDDIAGYRRVEHTFVVEEAIPARGGTQTVNVEGNGTGLVRFGFSPTKVLKYDNTEHTLVTATESPNLTINDLRRSYSSGDVHPLYPSYLIPFDYNTTFDDQGNSIIEEISQTYNFGSGKWRYKQNLTKTELPLRVIGVRYLPTEGARLRVTTDLGNRSHPSVDPNTEGWDNNGINKHFSKLKISYQRGESLMSGGKGSNETDDRSTTRLISEACREINWRPNSYKVLSIMSNIPLNKDFVEWGSYFYGSRQTELLDIQKLLLHRFDNLYCRYIVNEDSFRDINRGVALRRAFLNVLGTNQGYDDVASANSFLQSVRDELNSGDGTSSLEEMTLYWYLGGVNDADGNLINYKGVDAKIGRVTAFGKVLLDETEGFALSLGDVISYYACEEDLLFFEIDQLHLAVRPELYELTGINQAEVFKGDIYETEFENNLSGFTKFHVPTNFSNPVVKSILVHRNGTKTEDELTQYNFSTIERLTGSGIDFTNPPDITYVSNVFTNGYNERSRLLPTGQYYSIHDKISTTWLKDIYTVIYGALGEGAGVLYSDFGVAGNLRTEEESSNAPGYERLTDPQLFPSPTIDGHIPGYIDFNNQGAKRAILGGDPAFEHLARPELVRNPYPRTLASPSIDNKLLSNAFNSNESPGITLKGKSAIYESIAIMMRDSSNSGLNLVNSDPRTSSTPRNPARKGTININAILSDGDDTDSFGDYIIKHYVKYLLDGQVNINQLEQELFEEIFLDNAGNLQVRGGQIIQQRHIYTNEVLNSLHILSYLKSLDDQSSSFVIDTGIGYGSEVDSSNPPVRLPHRILSNNNKDSLTGVYLGNEQRLNAMISLFNYSPVDDMGLVVPFYRGSQDAVSSLVIASEVQGGDISNLSLFPNPYRFVPYIFPVSASISSKDLEVPESAVIFSHLAEEGPSVTISFDLTAIIGNYNLIYAPSSNPNYGEEDELVTFSRDTVNATVHSKLGYFHSIRPNLGGQSVAVQTVVFDPGFDQKTSEASKILAQNLGGEMGTPFKGPSTILSNTNLVKRNEFNFPVYEQNSEANLTDQRLNYLNNAFDPNEVKSTVVEGFPLISKRELDMNVNGEYLGKLRNIEDDVFLFKVDKNGNNRNAVYRLFDSDPNDAVYEPRWRKIVSTELNTGGKEIFVNDLKRIKYEGRNSPAALIRDEETDTSNILVLGDNDIWRTLIDKRTTFTSTLEDRNSQDAGSKELRMPVFNKSYFSEIMSEQSETESTQGGVIQTDYNIETSGKVMDSLDGFIYVGGSLSTGGGVEKVTVNGVRKWSKDVMSGTITAIKVLAGIVYVGNSDGQILALSTETGDPVAAGITEPTSYHSPGNNITGIDVRNGVVYTVGEDSKITAIDASLNEELWSANLTDPLTCVKADNIFLLAGDINGNLKIFNYNFEVDNFETSLDLDITAVVSILIAESGNAFCVTRTKVREVQISDSFPIVNDLPLNRTGVFQGILSQGRLYIADASNQQVSSMALDTIGTEDWMYEFGEQLQAITLTSGLLLSSTILTGPIDEPKVQLLSTNQESEVSRSHLLLQRPTLLFSTNKAMTSTSVETEDMQWVLTSYYPSFGVVLRNKRDLDTSIISRFSWEDQEFDRNVVVAFADEDNTEAIIDENGNEVFNENDDDFSTPVPLLTRFGPRAGFYTLDPEVSLAYSDVMSSDIINPNNEYAKENAVIFLTLGAALGNGSPTNWTQQEGVEIKGDPERIIEIEYKYPAPIGLEGESLENEYPFYYTFQSSGAVGGRGGNHIHLRTIIANPDPNEPWAPTDDNLNESEIYYSQSVDAPNLSYNSWTPLRENISMLERGKGAWRRLTTFINSGTFAEESVVSLQDRVNQYITAKRAFRFARAAEHSNIEAGLTITQGGDGVFEPNIEETRARNILDVLQNAIRINEERNETAAANELRTAYSNLRQPTVELLEQEESLISYQGGTVSEFEYIEGQTKIENALLIKGSGGTDPNYVLLVTTQNNDPTTTEIYVAESSGLATNPIRSHWGKLNFNFSYLTDIFDRPNGFDSDMSLLTVYKNGNSKVALIYKDTLDASRNIKIQVDFSLGITRTVPYEVTSIINDGVQNVQNVQNAPPAGGVPFIKDAYSLSNEGNLYVIKYFVPGFNILQLAYEDALGNITYSPTHTYDLPDFIAGAEIVLSSNNDEQLAVTVSNDTKDPNWVIQPMVWVLNLSIFVASADNAGSSIINVINQGLTRRLNCVAEGGITEFPLTFKANMDPYVYPRFPHGENWIRDGVIGVNQGQFTASRSAKPNERFSWDADRYIRDDVWRTIRDTIKRYDSLI